MAMSTVIAEFRADISQLQASLATATASVNAAAARIGSAGNQMGQSFDNVGNNAAANAGRIAEAASMIGYVMTGLGIAIGAGLGTAAKTFAEFEQEIRNAAVISASSANEIDGNFSKLSDAAKKLGASSSYTAREVAAAFSEMARNGFNTTQIIAAMPGVISSAEAANEDLARTAEVVTAALNAFALKAQDATRVADIMALAANRTAAGIDDMGYSFKYAGPMAHALGISIEELAAATGILANAGIKGTTAGTSLRSILNDLASPTGKATEALKSLGISAFDSNDKFIGLIGVVEQFEKAMAGMTDKEKQDILGQIFEVDSATAMNQFLTVGSKNLRQFAKELENSAGSSAKMAAAMKKTFAGAMKQLQGTIETTGIVLGEHLAPGIAALGAVLQRLLQRFLALPKPMQKLITFGLALASIILTVGGLFLIFSGYLGFVASAMGVTMSAAAMMTLQFSLIVVAIGAVIGALVWAYNEFQGFRDFIQSIWEPIYNRIKSVFERLKPVVFGIIIFILESLQSLVTWWETNGAIIVAAAKWVWDMLWQGVYFVIDLITIAWYGLVAWWEENGPIIMYAASQVWSFIENVASWAIQLIIDLLGGIIKWWEENGPIVTEKAKKLWDDIKVLADWAFKEIIKLFNDLKLWWEENGPAIKEVVFRVLGGIKDIAMFAFDGILKMWEQLKSWWETRGPLITETAGLIWEGIKGAASGVIELILWLFGKIKEWWDEYGPAIVEAAKFVWDKIWAVVDEVIVFVVGQLNKILKWWDEKGPMIMQAAENVWDFFANTVGVAIEVIWGIFKFIWPLIEWIIVDTWETIMSAINNAIDFILSIIEFFAALFTGDWEALWEATKKLLRSALGLLWDLFNLFFGGKILKFIGEWGIDILKYIGDAWKGVKETTSKWLENVWKWIKDKWDQINKFIDETLGNIKKSISDKLSQAGKVVKEKLDSIGKFFSDMWGEAKEWGKNLIQMFIDGIKSMASKVGQAAKDIANKIKDFIGFSSPTELGPASTSDEWAPNFVQMFADGLKDGMPLIAKMSKMMAATLQPQFNPQLGGTTLSGIGNNIEEVNNQVTITGNTFIVRNDTDIKNIAYELNRQATTQMRAKGMIGQRI